MTNEKKKLAAIVSPPFENSTLTQDKEFIHRIEQQHRKGSRFQGGNVDGYGQSPNQIGNQKNESYSEAMIQVYKEAAKSGISPLVTITKNPTKAGALRRLDLDTARMLILAGYTIIDYHKAKLLEQRRQLTLKGDIKKEIRGRVSFFKRLSHQRGNVISEHEDVIIATIPE